MKNCKHCQRLMVCPRPRGLCHFCYHTLTIRILYPFMSNQGPHGLDANRRRENSSNPAPTLAPPGSEEKLQELVRRAENNENLWNKEDSDRWDTGEWNQIKEVSNKRKR